MKTTRPHNLPNELPDPPTPPTNHRWEYRGKNWTNNTYPTVVCFYRNKGGWATEGGNGAYGRKGHYLEAVRLRETPIGYSPLADGWEYWGEKQLEFPSAIETTDIAYHTFGGRWNDAFNMWTGIGKGPWALRIGSKVHFENIVEQPANFQASLEHLDSTPDSPQEFSQQDLATSLTHLKTLLNEYGAGCFGDIREFVARFDPPFDWISFWDSLPAWHNYVAQDDWSGAWYSFEVKPHKGKDSWHSLKCLEIPTEYCPPATDWESSLVVRPGYAEK